MEQVQHEFTNAWAVLGFAMFLHYLRLTVLDGLEISSYTSMISIFSLLMQFPGY